MTGNVLDVVLVVAVLLFAVSGYRQGLVVGVLSFVGFLGGGILGARLAPGIADGVASGLSAPLVGLGVVVLGATLGQLVAAAVGGLLRRRLTWHPARVVDAVGGSLVSAVSVLLVAWLVGSALASSPFRTAASAVRESRVIEAVDGAVPAFAERQFRAFRGVVDSGFPRVFDALTPTRPRPVPPPDPRLQGSPVVRASQEEVLKVTGVAEDCNRSVEGTGFVYAPQRVMTNAHVVAGVTEPFVEVAGKKLPGVVVLFDAGRDVAVLRVPGLVLQPLAFAGAAEDGADAVVVGYPQDGPYTATAARVRRTQSARGPDIYEERRVVREVYELFARVRPGNSGGPLLAPDGKVYGVVFAAAADDPDTGYALTAGEVASDARAGASATRQVDTRGCD